MVLQAIQFKASLENVAELRFPEDHVFKIDLDQQGNPVKEGVDISREDVADIEGSRGVANLVLPSLKANISILDSKNDKRVHEADCEGTYCADENEQWKTVCVFESRGVEISKWHLTGGYHVISNGDGENTHTRKTWKSVSLGNGEFYEVDEQEEPKPVSISDFETRVITYQPKK